MGRGLPQLEKVFYGKVRSLAEVLPGRHEVEEEICPDWEHEVDAGKARMWQSGKGMLREDLK